MTDTQILDQLRRLKMFGNMDQNEADEYIRVLRGLNYTDLVWSIDWLIQNHKYKSFPIPNEIYSQAKNFAVARAEEERSKKISEEGGPRHGLVSAFMGALGAAMRLDREHFHAMRDKIIKVNSELGDNPANEERLIFELNALKKQCERSPTRKNFSDIPKCIPGPMMVTQKKEESAEKVKSQTKNDDGLPF